MKFAEYLKTLFFLLLFLQFAPPLVKSIKKQYERMIVPKARVGLIKIKGILYNSDRYNKYLNKFFKDPKIKAILIKMDCPGGASGTAQSIYQEILSLKKKYNKPIVTLVENMCASGGYYIACATDHIIAPPSAVIGSIGTAFQYLFQLKEFIQSYKIGYKALTAGKYKTATDPFVDITEDQEKMLQGVLKSSYNQFTQDVSKSRKLTINDKNKWAEGRLFTGSQALSLGLIDAVGSPYTAIKVIREKALIDEKEEILWVKPPKKTGFAKFFDDQENDEGSMFSQCSRFSKLAPMVPRLLGFLQKKLAGKRIV
ncbi:signal peptide peptidase SppA [Candidatus Dependentiae bacterium]